MREQGTDVSSKCRSPESVRCFQNLTWSVSAFLIKEIRRRETFQGVYAKIGFLEQIMY